MKKANGGFVNNEDDIRRIVQERTPNFEYIGGYTGSEGSLRIRCKTCGTEMVRSIISVRHKNVKCRGCSRAEIAARKEEKKELAEKERQRRKEEAFWSRETAQQTMMVCIICGGVFLPAAKTQKTCGGSCTRKLANNKDRRVKRRKSAAVDTGITLQEVYRRDSGLCYLCGEGCSWEDIESRNGVKIAGDLYPSIDHVRPLAKGGTHTWNNVRLAHRICNYRKSDGWIAPA